jgi:nucleoside-diphosphate-sugar epimerase
VKRNLDQNDKLAISYNNLFFINKAHGKHYVHLAGKAHDIKKTSRETEYTEVNYELTKRIFDTFIDDIEAQTFVFISTVKAVADTVQGVLTEDESPNPISAYGRSKLMAERYILDNLPNDKTVVILRPCMIHGPRNTGNLNLLYNIIAKGIPWPLGAYHNSRSFFPLKIYVMF